MLHHLKRSDLAVLDRNRDLHRLKAVYFVHVAHSRGLVRSGSFRRGGRGCSAVLLGSLLECAVDGVRGHRRAGYRVEARRRDVLSDQALEALFDHVRAEARRLVVLHHLKRGDLAVLDRNRNLHRPKAVYFVYVAGTFRLFLRNQIAVIEVNRLANGLEDRLGRNRRTGKRLDTVQVAFCRRSLAVELRTEIRVGRPGAVALGLVVFGHDDFRDYTFRRDAHAQANLIRKALGGKIEHVADCVVAHRALIDGLDRAVIADKAHHIQRTKRLGGFHIALAVKVLAFQRGHGRIRLHAEYILGIRHHLAHRRNKRLGGNRRARDGLHLGVDLFRIGGQTRELALKGFLAHLHA